MKMGFGAVRLNTAVAAAADPARMARAFAMAIDAGRTAYEAGLMEMRDMAVPSTPVAGTPFFDLEKS
jgi:thiazole synthase